MGWAGVGCHGSWGWSKHDHMHWGYHRSGHRVGRRPNDTCMQMHDMVLTGTLDSVAVDTGRNKVLIYVYFTQKVKSIMF